jgi:hypothetical protein
MEVSGRTKRHLEHYGITSDQQADMVIQFNSENFQKNIHIYRLMNANF